MTLRRKTISVAGKCATDAQTRELCLNNTSASSGQQAKRETSRRRHGALVLDGTPRRGMLTELLSHERALLELVLALLDTRNLATCARAARWLHAHALEAAEQRVSRLIQTEPRVARWRRTSAAGSSAVLREAHHIEAGVQYVVRISGRYRLDTNVVLDIAPSGDYVNYSTASLEAPGHCFRGVATVAGVLPSPDPSVGLLSSSNPPT